MSVLVDPINLFMPVHRPNGPDLFKYQRQVRAYGRSTLGMPPLAVNEGRNGMQIVDGATRAARVALQLPGHLVPVEVLDSFPGIGFTTPQVKDILVSLPDPPS